MYCFRSEGMYSNTRAIPLVSEFMTCRNLTMLGCELNRLRREISRITVKVWKGVTQLPGWRKRNWKAHEPIPLRDLVERLDANGYDLLEKMLKYEPQERITAEQAMSHPFFDDLVLPPSIQKKYTGLKLPTTQARAKN